MRSPTKRASVAARRATSARYGFIKCCQTSGRSCDGTTTSATGGCTTFSSKRSHLVPAGPPTQGAWLGDGHALPTTAAVPWGYTELLEALDPLHPEHAERAAWVPGGFDPEVFDLEEATEMMRSPRPLQGW